MPPNRPRPLVLATGVFDLLHAEHLALLQMASLQGRYLVVGINSDESVRRIKGQERPIIDEHQRAALLRALKCVDEVVVFVQDTPEQLVKYWQPDVLVKGHDYRGTELPEAQDMAQWGGRVWTAPTSSRISTSQIINRVRSLP